MPQSSIQRIEEFAALVNDIYSDRPVRLLEVGNYDLQDAFRKLFQSDRLEFVKLDFVPGADIDYVPSNTYEWSGLADNSFDVVVCREALAHLHFPWLTMEQIARKLKPGGLACLVEPSHGAVQAQPVDCYRINPDGIVGLAAWANLQVMQAGVDARTDTPDSSTDQQDCFCIMKKPTSQAKQTKRPANRSHQAPANPQSPLHQTHLRSERGEDNTDIASIVARLKLPARRVLEIGCKDTAAAQALRAQFNTSHHVGIDTNLRLSPTDRSQFSTVIDTEADDISAMQASLDGHQFDLIVAADVLDHLYDPWDWLTQLSGLLDPGGHLVASVFNVQHLSVLDGLASGRWTYTRSGNLGATNIRFFTLQEIHTMMTASGFNLVDVEAAVNQDLVESLSPEGNSLSTDRLTIKNLSRQEFAFFNANRLVITARKPA